MNVNLGIWSRLTSVVLVLVVAAVLLLIGTCYLPVIRENERMQTQIMKLEAQVQADEEKLKEHQSQIDALQNDSKALERLAREKLGYAKPNETVIYFENTNEMR